MLGADHGTDPSTGLAATRTETLTRSPISDGRGPREVEQSVSVFGSAGEAETVVTSVESQWRSCGSSGVAQGSGEDHWTFEFSAVQFRGDVVSVSMAASNVESGGRACQTAIGIRANVIVEAWALPVGGLPDWYNRSGPHRGWRRRGPVSRCHARQGEGLAEGAVRENVLGSHERLIYRCGAAGARRIAPRREA
jgi:PknH-like protein